MSKIYIAGPMTGYPEFNFPAFYRAEQELRAAGFTVFNPANKEDEQSLDTEAFKTGDTSLAIDKGFDFRAVYLWDVSAVVAADAIIMLDGWEQSPGACGEHAVAVAMKKHYKDKYQIYYSVKDAVNGAARDFGLRPEGTTESKAA